MRCLAVVLVMAQVATAAVKPRVLIDAPAALAKPITKLLSKKYSPRPVKKSLTPDPTAKEVAEVTRAVEAIAVVQARLDSGVWVVRVLNGADGTPLSTIRFKNAKKLVLPRDFSAALAEGLTQAVAPRTSAAPAPSTPPVVAPQRDESPPTPTPTPTVDPTSTSTQVLSEPFESDSSPHDKPLAFRFGVGFTGLNRQYTYRDDVFLALAQYRLPFAPAAAVELELFPAAFFTRGLAANFGIVGSFSTIVGVASKNGGVSYPTSSTRLLISAVGRIPVRAFEFNAGLGYALQTFSIAATAMGTPRPNIPNVQFGGLRPSLGATVHLSPIFHLHAGAGYQLLLSKGELGSAAYFPRAVGAGFDTSLCVAIRPTAHFELRAQGDYSRYFFSLKPEVGDPYIAGGALDQYLTGTLTANFVWL